MWVTRLATKWAKTRSEYDALVSRYLVPAFLLAQILAPPDHDRPTLLFCHSHCFHLNQERPINMDKIEASSEEIVSVQHAAHTLTQEHKNRILALCVANNVSLLDKTLDQIVSMHDTTKGAVLLFARDSLGRNAAHHAAIGHSEGKFPLSLFSICCQHLANSMLSRRPSGHRN